MISALHALKSKVPAKLICAVPIALPDTIDKVAAYCDEILCLETHYDFRSVGQFYRHFPQVEDEEVIEVLKQGV